MNLLQFVKARVQRGTQLVALAEMIAIRAFDKTWQRVRGRILDLHPDEARGYVRARAGNVVREAVVAQCGESQLAGVYRLAMEATIQRAVEHAHLVRSQVATRRAA